jgi:hypothetical protein
VLVPNAAPAIEIPTKPKGTHASPRPHDRRGHPRHLKKGDRIVWVKGRKVNTLIPHLTRGRAYYETTMKPVLPLFESKLRPLTILDLERMSPAARARREAAEEQERRAWLDEQRRKPQARKGQAMSDEPDPPPSVISFPSPKPSRRSLRRRRSMRCMSAGRDLSICRSLRGRR